MNAFNASSILIGDKVFGVVDDDDVEDVPVDIVGSIV
jgi:hypothetical protein